MIRTVPATRLVLVGRFSMIDARQCGRPSWTARCPSWLIPLTSAREPVDESEPSLMASSMNARMVGAKARSCRVWGASITWAYGARDPWARQRTFTVRLPRPPLGDHPTGGAVEVHSDTTTRSRTTWSAPRLDFRHLGPGRPQATPEGPFHDIWPGSSSTMAERFGCTQTVRHSVSLPQAGTRARLKGLAPQLTRSGTRVASRAVLRRWEPFN